jgi:L-lactate dehydrogenase complex protein LldG
MSSREDILAAVSRNKPAVLPFPRLPDIKGEEEDKTQRFVQVASAIGSSVHTIYALSEINTFLQKRPGNIIIGVDGLEGYNLPEFTHKTAGELEQTDVVILKGDLAVAENGAVWITEKSCLNRMLPFICTELVLVVEEAAIVHTMHEAYEKLKTDEEGYSLFLAGPSKTADIEQSLVIGAHGPLGLHLFILKNRSE